MTSARYAFPAARRAGAGARRPGPAATSGALQAAAPGAIRASCTNQRLLRQAIQVNPCSCENPGC